MSCQNLYCSIAVKQFDTAKDAFLVSLPILRHAATFAAVVWFAIKHLFHAIPVLLHFGHKNDITIIIKLHRATCTCMRLIQFVKGKDFSNLVPDS